MSTTVSRDWLTGLNPAQRDAVLHFEGPMLVLAGAGSGKTRVLTTRIAHLIDHHGVDPKHILAVTFTNKAAGEMRERIARLLGTEPVGMWCGTFHSVGARMLRTAAHLVGRTPSFTIYDEDDAIGVVKRIMERLRISAKDHAPRAILDAISDAKNALVTVGEYEAMAKDPHARAVAPVYKELEGALRQANAVTFDDLLVLPVRLLEEHVHVRAQYQDRFRFILVDEYQDTNRAQYRFVKLIGGQHANVMVVGDDDQSIYGWRGADIRNILDFERDFPQAGIVRLEENYRSTPQILDLANVAISPNTERRGKTLRSTRPPGERGTVVGAYDDRDEADYIVGPDRAGKELGWFSIEFTFLNHAPINKYVAVRYGGGAGLGIITGGLQKYDVPCAAGATNQNPEPGCVPSGVTSPSGNAGTATAATGPNDYDLPPVFPVVNAIIGLQIRPTPKAIVNIEAGIRTIPFLGVSAGYFFN